MSMQRNIALVAFGIAIIPISVAGYFIHRDMNSPPPSETPAGHAEGGYGLGDQRFAVLTKLTKAYVAHHADAPAAMRNGTLLAPPAFLNEQLEQENARWRVRDVKGLVADIYDIS